MKLLICTAFKTTDKLSLSKVALERGWEVKHLHPNAPVEEAVETARSFDVFVPRYNPASYLKVAAITRALEEQTDLYISLSSKGLLDSMDKWRTYELFNANNIPTPLTVKVSSRTEAAGLTLDFPVIFKPTDGSLGRGIFVVQSPAELELSLEGHFKEYQAYVAQPFIQESTGVDHRLFMIDGKLVAAMERRSSDGKPVANIAQGASAQSIVPGEQEINIASGAAVLFGAVCAGVDILNSNDGPVVLEVNTSPGFHISKVTGVSVQSKLLDALERHVKEKNT